MKNKEQDIRISDYRYNLPDERIAKYPLGSRDQSKLLVYEGGSIKDQTFSDLPYHIPKDSVMVRNNTRVIQARLDFTKETGAEIEIFCLRPADPADYEQNLSQTKSSVWYCLIGNAKKWKNGILSKKVQTTNGEVIVHAERLTPTADSEKVRFFWEPDSLSLSEILDSFGQTPIPPYLHRPAEPGDKNRYQTIYAQTDGSVAAPTAGLHFTPDLFDTLRTGKVKIAEITLHVGAGTFTPVKSDRIGDHVMHTEHITIQRDDLHHIFNNLDGGITAVGTTSLRTLESLYWLAHLLKTNQADLTDKIHIDQWLPYETTSVLSRRQAILEIIMRMAILHIESFTFSTSLIIVPGYKIGMADRLITNFHQPGSTLLLLVAAFAGNNWKTIYDHALKNNYRFLSYGDSSLICRNIDNG